MALFTNSQAGNDNLGGSGTDMDGTVTAYSSSASNEVGNSGDYSAGGGSLTRVDPTTSGTTAFTDFSDLTFGSTTITARGALIYNDTASGDPAVCILDFGSNKSSTSGNFTIVFPTADSSNAIIRIA